MRSSGVDGREALMAACDQLDAALDTLLGSPLDALTHAELLAVDGRLERAVSRVPTVRHRLIARLAAEASPTALGGTSLTDVLATRLRISKVEARRRITHAELLGPRQAITGEPLPPTLPNTAAAQARGAIGAEHVREIERFFDKLPISVPVDVAEQAEAQLAELACGLGPLQLRAAADRLMGYLHPDGKLSDTDRARRRYLNLGTQQADGITPITGLLDPETAATLEPIFAKWAALGMCNPDGPDTPCVDGTPDAATTARDTRSQGQRNHDALKAMATIAVSGSQ